MPTHQLILLGITVVRIAITYTVVFMPSLYSTVTAILHLVLDIPNRVLFATENNIVLISCLLAYRCPTVYTLPKPESIDRR